jgi:hypothetical protein
MDTEDAHPAESRPPTLEDLLKICRSLNNAGARYLVIGGFAIIQHGFTRATGKGSIPQIRMFYVDGLK